MNYQQLATRSILTDGVSVQVTAAFHLQPTTF